MSTPLARAAHERGVLLELACVTAGLPPPASKTQMTLSTGGLRPGSRHGSHNGTATGNWTQLGAMTSGCSSQRFSEVAAKVRPRMVERQRLPRTLVLPASGLLRSMPVSRTVIAVKDGFYVIPIGVEDECGVVPRVIVRSQPGTSVVDPSGHDGCGVERINRFAVWRGERNMHRSGRQFLFRDPEVLIVDREAGSQRVFNDRDTEGLQRPLVERATPSEVAYRQPHMIEQARSPTWHGSSIPH